METFDSMQTGLIVPGSGTSETFIASQPIRGARVMAPTLAKVCLKTYFIGNAPEQQGRRCPRVSILIHSLLCSAEKHHILHIMAYVGASEGCKSFHANR